jgi:hypothetical protein
VGFPQDKHSQEILLPLYDSQPPPLDPDIHFFILLLEYLLYALLRSHILGPRATLQADLSQIIPCLDKLSLSPQDDFTMSSTTIIAARASPTQSNGAGVGQGSQGISFVAFITALISSLVIFGIQMLAFIVLKDKLARIL